jgi:CRP-like cAMP-binding protein
VVRSLETVLKEHPFLSDLPPEHVRVLAGCAANRRFQVGDYLWRQGEQADVFCLIRSGQVALEILVPHQGPVQIETVGEGQALGWSWLVPPYRWHFDVRAVTLVRALVLDGACLRQKLEQNQELGYQLLKRFTTVLADRLTAMRLKVLELSGAAPRDGDGNGGRTRDFTRLR